MAAGRTFSSSAPVLWNYLPSDIKTCVILNTFNFYVVHVILVKPPSNINYYFWIQVLYKLFWMIDRYSLKLRNSVWHTRTIMYPWYLIFCIFPLNLFILLANSYWGKILFPQNSMVKQPSTSLHLRYGTTYLFILAKLTLFWFTRGLLKTHLFETILL